MIEVEFMYVILIFYLFYKIISKDKKTEKYFKKFADSIENLESRVIKNDSKIDSIIKTNELESHNNHEKMNQMSNNVLAEIEKNKKNINLEINKEITNLRKNLNQLLADNQDLRNQLSYFTEIKSDSTLLNEYDIGFNTGSLDSNKNNTVAYLNDQENQIEETSIELDPEQLEAYNFIENSQSNVLVTGKAGTGKSFLLKYLISNTKKRVLRLAPTGVAAINISGETLHKAFGFYNIVNLNIEDINLHSIRMSSEKKIVLKMIDLLVIDEVSMVRADVLEKVSKILQVLNENEDVFGGKQVVLFGDLFQLPPIAKSSEMKFLYDMFGGRYFFNSKSYNKGNFYYIELSINHRQKNDQTFFEILNRIRDSSVTDEDISILNNRLTNNDINLRRIVKLYPTKAKAEKVNIEELNRIKAKEYTYLAEVVTNKCNDQTLNLENDFIFTERLKLKLGSLVMFISNDFTKRWVNGTLGIVSFINEEEIKVTVDGYEWNIRRELFKKMEAVYKNGRIEYEPILVVSQFPIILAYALTIHKSQGNTYQQIVCDVTDSFATGQVYVALSRCSSLDGLHLIKPITRDSIRVDLAVRNFCREQRNFIENINR